MHNVLIVEDEQNILKLMTIRLQQEHFNVFTATDGIAALSVLENNAINLLLIDIMMPLMDGYELLKIIRASGNLVPVIMITSRFGIDDKVKAYELGVDDYMVKPINHRELLLRIEALLRRYKISSERQIVIGDTTIKYDTMTISNQKNSVILPKKEFLILYKLMSHLDTVFTKHQLIEEFWGYYTDSDDATIKVHINRVRNKIKFFDNIDIVTIRGLGYKGVHYEKKP